MRRLCWLLGICLAAGCSKQAGDTVASSPTPAPPPKLLVMATIAPMYCFTKNVTGDLADVEMIVPPGVQPRGFQPSAEEAQRILQADIVVENGFGFEDWMDRIEAKGLKPGAERVLAARGTGLGIPGLSMDPDSSPSDAPFDPTQPPDPHVWLDPVMAIKEVQNIRDALMARDPTHADDYLANENRYEAALRDLDDEVGRMTVEIPKRRLVCADETFSYFLSRYQFTVVKAQGDAVLAPAGAKPAVAPSLPLIQLDPMESGPASPDFYEQATRANVEALRKGLLQ